MLGVIFQEHEYFVTFFIFVTFYGKETGSNFVSNLKKGNRRFEVTIIQVELNHFSSKERLIKVYSFYV